MSYPSLLDQLSTSQTFPPDMLKNEHVGGDLKTFIASQLEQANFFKALDCMNNAPYIFFVDNAGVARLVQGCCNNWTCPRCGHMRALEEYGRMVNGAKVLSEAGEKLFFLTLTCRGKDVTLEEAESGYAGWTNKLLTTLRADAKRAGRSWYYAQVTERQKRGHPHSHLITTYRPNDALAFDAGEMLPSRVIAKHDCLYSAKLEKNCTSAGLGRMVDLSAIKNPVAVAVYVSKYMFKDAISEVWPKGWKRVRYSQSWPKLEREKPEIAFPLVRFQDWLKMQALDLRVHADCEKTREAAYARAITCVV